MRNDKGLLFRLPQTHSPLSFVARIEPSLIAAVHTAEWLWKLGSFISLACSVDPRKGQWMECDGEGESIFYLWQLRNSQG